MAGYKPFGVPMRDIGTVIITVEEYESLRLADYENLTHEEAARKMEVSRPTFTRIYDKARKNVARAFAEGKAIVIQGGTYRPRGYWYRCNDCNETMATPSPAGNCQRCNSENLDRIDEQQPGA